MLVGLAIGRAVLWARRYASQDPSIQNTISLLTPFAAYLLAEELPTYLWEQLHDRFGFPGELHFSGCSRWSPPGSTWGGGAPMS